VENRYASFPPYALEEKSLRQACQDGDPTHGAMAGNARIP
jgi:hypothetical protein